MGGGADEGDSYKHPVTCRISELPDCERFHRQRYGSRADRWAHMQVPAEAGATRTPISSSTIAPTGGNIGDHDTICGTNGKTRDEEKKINICPELENGVEMVKVAVEDFGNSCALTMFF